MSNYPNLTSDPSAFIPSRSGFRPGSPTQAPKAVGSVWSSAYSMGHSISATSKFLHHDAQPRQNALYSGHENLLESESHTALAIDPIRPAGTAATAKLVEELQSKEETVSELKLQVETLVAAMMVGSTLPSSDVDMMETAHRMQTRLRTLREENERLMSLATNQRVAQLEVEIDALREQNRQLKLRLKNPSSQFAVLE